MPGRLLITIAFCSFVAAAQSALPEPANRKVDFATEIAPVFQSRCYACHGPKVQMSNLRLDDGAIALHGGASGAVIKPGHSADSPLVLRVSGAAGFAQMPPSGPKLTSEQIGLIRAWIDQGALWPGVDAPTQPAPAKSGLHWAFQPIRQPEPPPVSAESWVRNAIDRFVLARLEREKRQPSPAAPRPVLLRRLSLDLTGLPPTPGEIDAFVGDARPDAYERQVDRLLASPHFGEKWARHWLDKARYADSDGYEKDWFRPWAWRYRDWVIHAMNADMPFDQFTIRQIAGDLLLNATEADRIATGFNRNTLTNREGGVDNAQFRFENTVDRASTVGVVWLGMTVGCAQCHNHKYDPITQKDFYSMFAFFDNVEEADIDAPRPGELGPYLEHHREYEQKRQTLLDEYHVPELQADWEQHIRQAIAEPGKYTDWDLAWDVVKKLTEGGDGEKILLTPLNRRSPREREVLTEHFIRNYFFAVGKAKVDEAKFEELDKKLKALKAEYPQLSQAMTIAESASPHPSYLRVHGDYRTTGIQVVPAVLSVLPQPSKPDHLTRLDLAGWIVSHDNPLTARVAVNRIWQELFAQGIVKSSDDFGTRGDPPSHPELLDWLAADFRDNGWSRKKTIRKIVLSATYRQSSAARPELESIDPANALLARQTRLRLPAELIRDSVLAVSGLLNTGIGGPSIRPPQPAGVTELGYGKKAGAGWDETKGTERYRRGLYIQFQRSTPYPQLINFDAPKSDMPVCKRERSNTSLQALNLLNDPVFVEGAAALAYRIVTEAPTPADRLRWGFRLALGREPDDKEASSLESYLQQQMQIFTAHPEDAAKLAPFAADGSRQIELAAWTGVASVLMNLDEFITRE